MPGERPRFWMLPKASNPAVSAIKVEKERDKREKIYIGGDTSGTKAPVEVRATSVTPPIVPAGSEPVRQLVLLLADALVCPTVTIPPSARWRHRRFWRSIYGRTICARCHPPAVPELVAEWVSHPLEAGPPG
jgi:hypothetical protein